ncbi:GvpL/GvpF family gas vesicle protein [Acidipila sp. EB88]|uniref:GvpL/GvpF family gas vesicle protein n=1 Tax=Acidipila sp. EB88 TaxID=2305226 RepID=UPI000F5EB346|nr:GvpL/GvpF family gas vesicle protein [Acidipila sp. EB88]RRA47717.1 gas vesicle protein GvpFL [Acidipila sp. EB88]
MAWYAYCVTEKQAFPALLRHRKPVPLESVTGVEGNQVFLYPASDLAVLVSEHIPTNNPNPQNAKDHARVIADCFKISTVLPFRYGTVFANDELLRRSIRSNQKHFLANLASLHGKCEMHIKLTLEDCCREQIRDFLAAGTGTGRTYLTDLRETATRQRERQTRARSLSMQLNRMFAPVAEEISCRRLESGKMQLDVSHLISSRLVERYQNKFLMAREQMRDCQLQLSGPWPPYHFVHSLTRPTAPAPMLPQARAVPA